MFIQLPTGYQSRPATEADIPAIIELLRSCDIADYGEANAYDAAELAHWWSSSKAATILIMADDGALAGYGEVLSFGQGVIHTDGYVHPGYRGRGLGQALISWTEAEAQTMIPNQPEGAQVIVQSGMSANDMGAQGLFTTAGYQMERTFHRMRIDMTEQPPSAEWPTGLMVRSAVRGQDEPAIFAAVSDAFQDHWGDTPRNYDRWYEMRINTPDYHPEQWYLAMDGATIAGFSLCSTDALTGWVNTLGVRRAYRRQGLARALLLHSFGEFWRAGVRRVSLGVDGTSLTGANRVYERAGMRTVQQWVVWSKVLRPGVDLRTLDLQAG